MKRLCIRQHKAKRRGLTLIEVLIALAIMGIGIAGLVAASSRCLAVARKAKNYENARGLLGEAEMKWQEYLLEKEEDEPLEADSESWSFNAPFEGYTGLWALEEVSQEADDENEGLFTLRLRISWSEHGQENYEEVVTYLYSPDETKTGSVTTKE